MHPADRPDQTKPPTPPDRAADPATSHLAPVEQRILVGAAVLIVLVVLIVAVISPGDDAPAATGPTTSTTTSAPTTTSRPSATPSTPVRPTSPPPAGVVADPDDVAVLVDRQRRLPEGYEPTDLVEAQVPFTFANPDPKRFLRRDVATATVELFGAAAVDGLPLRAVSGFRSEASQRDLHSAYVARDGLAAADRYSARPGHSEHQTGLAIDVTSLDGTCPAEDCFAGRPEATWLAEHAHEHGFIVRYPADGEALTGYSYEPWHLRFVGVELATALHRDGLTLDEWHRTVAR